MARANLRAPRLVPEPMAESEMSGAMPQGAAGSRKTPSATVPPLESNAGPGSRLSQEEPDRCLLTERQRGVLDFIQSWIDDRGYPPTIREIGDSMGIKSTNGVNDHLKALERKGYLVRDQAKSRALRPSELTDKWVDVPILGQIAAGLPILAEENIEDTVRVDSFFLGNHTQVFALRVVGESMIGDGIHNGDYIFVRKQVRAERGQIVVAMIEGEATVKRYYPEAERVRFQPSNPQMAPIYVHRRDFRETSIVGVVVGVYRRVH